MSFIELQHCLILNTNQWPISKSKGRAWNYFEFQIDFEHPFLVKGYIVYMWLAHTNLNDNRNDQFCRNVSARHVDLLDFYLSNLQC